MKTLLISLTLACALSSSIVFADSVIVTETSKWRSVPITVDPTAGTYTYTETVPSDSNYYYSYQGHRCFADKKTEYGTNPVTLKPTVTTGTEIYCYPE